MEGPARDLAAQQLRGFGATDADSSKNVDAIIINAAGCGAMLKDYAHMMHGTPTRRGRRASSQAKVAATSASS